jgi:hypothetical protein
MPRTSARAGNGRDRTESNLSILFPPCELGFSPKGARRRIKGGAQTIARHTGLDFFCRRIISCFENELDQGGDSGDSSGYAADAREYGGVHTPHFAQSGPKVKGSACIGQGDRVQRVMWQIENSFRVRLGGNTYINVQNLVEYKGTPLFTLKRHDDNGQLGIYFEIYDSAGQHIASVKRNQIYIADKGLYTVDGTANRYQVIEKVSGRVLCDIKRGQDAAPAELEVSVELYTPDGFLFKASPEETNVGGIRMINNTIMGCRTGIAIGSSNVSLG